MDQTGQPNPDEISRGQTCLALAVIRCVDHVSPTTPQSRDWMMMMITQKSAYHLKSCNFHVLLFSSSYCSSSPPQPDEFCPALALPRGGGLSVCFNNIGDVQLLLPGYSACSATCDDPGSASVESVPINYTCGPGGDWWSSRLRESSNLYPTCGRKLKFWIVISPWMMVLK